MLKSKWMALLAFVGSALVLVFAYTNCSKVAFEKDYSSTAFSASLDGKSLFYTNSSSVYVTVDLDSHHHNEVRLSPYADMDSHQIPWMPWPHTTPQKVLVELGPDLYAADGSKDGLIDIYIQARDSHTDVRTQTQVQVFLDTQSPRVLGKGLLEQGVQGQVMDYGQQVELEIDAWDQEAASGKLSGLDDKVGFRYGITRTGDCSEASLVSKTNWGPMRTRYNMDWPEADPLKTFYICSYVRDRAGNIAIHLSQPMTSLWTVVAGENSQGNGGSVTAPNVRFKMPYYFSLDPDNNLHFRDLAFRTQRVIYDFLVDNSRKIEESPFPLPMSGAFIFDSQKRAYVFSGGKVLQLSPDYQTQKTIVSNASGNTQIALRKYQNTERLLISFSTGLSISQNVHSYIFEIPLSAINNAPAAGWTIQELISNYKIAGNGWIPARSFTLPDRVVLSKNDPAPSSPTSSEQKYSVGYIRDIVAGADGRIYFATVADGSGRGWGHHTLRQLKPTNDGKLEQTILTESSWTMQMQYFKQKMHNNVEIEKLFLARHGGFDVVDLKANPPTLERPIASINGKRLAAIAIKPIMQNKDYEIFIGSTNHSQIFRFKSDYSLIEVLGRPVYNANDNLALASVLGNPDGLVEDPFTQDLYIVDSQNSVVWRVNPQGQIAVASGTYKTEDLFSIGYKFKIAGHFSANKKFLYYVSTFNVNNGSRITAVDLLNNTETVLPLSLVTAATDPNSKYNWGIDSLALVPEANGSHTLLMKRRWNVQSNQSWHASDTGFVHAVNINGTNLLSANSSVIRDITKGQADIDPSFTGVINNNSVIYRNELPGKLAVDSSKNIYQAEGPRLRVSNLNNGKTHILPIAPRGPIAVVEEGPFRYLVAQHSTQFYMYKLDSRLLFNSTAAPIVESKQLCLPGTTVAGVNDIIVSRDGNLIVSDANNARVLKYFIRDKNNQLVWKEHSASGCLD